MEIMSILASFLQMGVTVEQLHSFASAFGILKHPFMQDLLNHLLIQESTNDAETVSGADAFLESVSNLDTEGQTGDSDTQYEAWSPSFEQSVLQHEENISSSLACLNDGAFRAGKTYFCSQCGDKFTSYGQYAEHRAKSHATPNLDDQIPGPSGVSSARSSDSTGTDEHISAILQAEHNTPQPVPMDTGNDQVGNGDTTYIIELTGTKRFATSAATEQTFRVRFQNVWQGRRLRDVPQQLHRMFEDLLAKARESIDDRDLLRVVIRHNSLNHAIVVPLMPSNEMNVTKILDKIERVLQSEESLAIDDSFQVMVGSLHIPKGSGGARTPITKLTGPDNSIHKKTSMVQIVNKDQICLGRAIGVAYAKQCVVPDSEWKALRAENIDMSTPELLSTYGKISEIGYKNVRSKVRYDQKKLALLLCQKAGIPTDRPGSLGDIEAFEDALHVRIAVVAASLGNKFIRVPTVEEERRPILYLYLVEHHGLSHFHAITSISGFFCSSYFCDRCFKQYNTNTNHRCETTCLTCKSTSCTVEAEQSCRDCNMICRSESCFERHKIIKTKQNDEVSLSQCQKYWRCIVCKKVVNREKRCEEQHRCSEWLCKCCHLWVEDGHQCYLFPEQPKLPINKFIFFDFEASQDQMAQCTTGYAPKKCCETPCKDCNRCQNCFQTWCGQMRHIANFVVAQSVCNYCSDNPMHDCPICHQCGSRCSDCDSFDKESNAYLNPPCPETCGARQKIFQGDGTLQDFGDWLFSNQHKDATVLAHNMKGYDGLFLLEYLVSNSIRPSKCIYNGSKIMYMHIGKGLNIRILDSVNFIPMKLAALPKAFGLTEMCKGFFPHFFNTREHQHYIGPYPQPQAYGADYMSSDDREIFLGWHEKKIKSGDQFDFRKEMEEYCISDVDILRRACLQFRALMLEATNIDPFQYITIASVCMGIYKTRFLEAEYRATFEYPQSPSDQYVKAKKTHEGWFKRVNHDVWAAVDKEASVHPIKRLSSPIAQVPSAGYTQKDNYSQASIQWLEYEMELSRRRGKPLHIQHAMNGGEASVMYYKTDGTEKQRGYRSYKVDGLASDTVYEYHGCLWHGCPRCYKDRTTKHPRTGQTLEELYALTMIKKKIITQDLGYKYICIWEHDWIEKRNSDLDACDFVGGLDIQDRLDPRDSFFGGRTNAAKLHYNAQQDEKIKYVDFTSLYPYVNKYSKYPVGHPEIITDNFEEISSYFGIAKVKILPPRGLYHPVLPYRSNGKLKFPLCRVCADSESVEKCQHTDEERSIVGTWCTPEIAKGLKRGYTLLNIYEVYHWDNYTQYSPDTKDGGLFAFYVNTFLKYKQEASGWPKWCKTEADKRRYLDRYLEKEGIRLDYANIEKNPGLRALAKICLNSFWGKFGQRLNQGVCEFINCAEMVKFYNVLTDRTKRMKDFHIINEDNLHLEYDHQSGFVPEDMKTNIFLATFTTCWARLKLFSVLDKLQERALYYDTDSVIYVSRPGEYEPPLGDFLGELTDELDSGDFIVNFVSGGPKNYAYNTAKGHQVCKIRGFSLNFTNAQLLNFESVRDLVENIRPDESNTYNKRKHEDYDDENVITVTNPRKITRHKYTNTLYNREEKKRYRVVYDKRVIKDNLDTLPYGY